MTRYSVGDGIPTLAVALSEHDLQYGVGITNHCLRLLRISVMLNTQTA